MVTDRRLLLRADSPIRPVLGDLGSVLGDSVRDSRTAASAATAATTTTITTCSTTPAVPTDFA